MGIQESLYIAKPVLSYLLASHLSTRSKGPGQKCSAVSRPVISVHRWGRALISQPGVAMILESRKEIPRCA